MAIKITDRVRETSTTAGTGTFTLAGAVSGSQTFAAALSNGDMVPYCAVDTDTGAWEVGLGTYTTNTLARTKIYASSNSDAAVAWTAGTRDVFVTMPAEHISAQRVTDGGATAPTATDDSAHGHIAYQSLWLMGVSGEYYRCVGDTPTAAVWSHHGEVTIRAVVNGNSFNQLGGYGVGTATERNASLTDTAAWFDYAFGAVNTASCIGGAGYRTQWAYSAGIGFGEAGNAYACEVKSGALGTTTDATPAYIYPNDDSREGWFVNPSSAMEFDVRVVAWDDAGEVTKAWRITGLIKRGAAGSPAIVGTPTVTVIAADTGTSGWDAVVAADVIGATGEGLLVQVTGAAATTIQWGARIASMQVIAL
jgi:hypothetical protein